MRRVRKPSHTYAKHISTVKNQNMEARWYYTFQPYCISILLSQIVIQYYMNITLLERTKGRFTKYEEVDAHRLERILERWTKKVWKVKKQ